MGSCRRLGWGRAVARPPRRQTYPPGECSMSRYHGFWAALAVLCVVCVGLGSAEQSDDFKLEPGYTALFNGKDLTGWRYGKETLEGKNETSDKRFFVKDSIIVADEGKGIKDL